MMLRCAGACRASSTISKTSLVTVTVDEFDVTAAAAVDDSDIAVTAPCCRPMSPSPVI